MIRRPLFFLLLDIINSAFHLLNITTVTFVPTEPKKMFAK